MVAVAHLSPANERGVVIVRSAPVPRSRPVAASLTTSTYRRRRAVALLVATTVVLVLSLALKAVVGVPGTGAHAAPRAVAGPVYVVQPGDTFWDIARALHPDRDPRPLVARLVATHGGPVLRVGERIAFPDAA